MKKTALTFALFASLMVATSFTSPETVSPSYSNNKVAIDPAVGGPQKKRDFQGDNQLLSANYQLSLSSVNQSVGGNKKLD